MKEESTNFSERSRPVPARQRRLKAPRTDPG